VQRHGCRNRFAREQLEYLNVFRDRTRRARPAHLPRGGPAGALTGKAHSMTMSGSSLAQQLAAVLRRSAVRRQAVLAKQIG
jgi:hypothetical protein